MTRLAAFFFGFLLLFLGIHYLMAAPTVQIPGCPLGYACVDATMTVAQQQAVINTGGTDKAPIYYLPGDYINCSQITITNNGTIITAGAITGADNGTSGPPSPAPVRISCGAAGSFSNGQAYFLINAQYVSVQNLTFIGLNGLGGVPNVDCIQTLSGGNIIRFDNFEDCYNGVHLISVNTGCCGTFNQTTHVEFNTFIYNGNAGLLCETTTGSGCTDNFFNWNHFDVLNGAGGGVGDLFCGPGCANGQIIGNRIEDGGLGIELDATSASTSVFMTVSDNYFQQIQPIFFVNTDSVIVENNQFNCFLAVPAVSWGGTASGGTYLSGNSDGACSTGMYSAPVTTVDYPMSLNDFVGAQAYYDNATTASKLEGYNQAQNSGINVITPSGTTFTPKLDGNVRVFEIDLTANSTLADFPYHIFDLFIPITFKFKQDATGGRTVSYNAAYVNTPTIGTTASLCSYAQAHMTTTKVIFLGASVNNVSCS